VLVPTLPSLHPCSLQDTIGFQESTELESMRNHHEDSRYEIPSDFEQSSSMPQQNAMTLPKKEKLQDDESAEEDDRSPSLLASQV
jgi:hypothetical protein